MLQSRGRQGESVSCSRCKQRDPSVSAVIDGELVKDICEPCYSELVAGKHELSSQASFNRNRDMEDHAADVAQPRVGGKPNTDFIRNYPEQAKSIFTEEELRLYG